jgi:glutamyl-tRNA synthetase
VNVSVVRTRFAPSPTGSLHVGNARLAVLNWLIARHHGGSFILRVEDTDVERNVAGAEAAMLRDLRWLGLDWDEGPPLDGTPAPGPHAPYRQSERLGLYHEAAKRLTDAGHTYACYCTDEEIAQRRTVLEEGAREAPDPCRVLSAAERAAHERAGRAPALRFRVEAAEPVEVNDVIRGTIRFAADALTDFVLVRSDGRPTYNFGVVVDDVAMEITHVIRGSGHLSNTPRQVLLFRALGAALPVFAHVPTVLDPERRKLSKRTGAQALADYRAQGYHPDAMVNYLSLLSWSSPSGAEVLTRTQLIEQISLERILASDVVFDPLKLRWLSGKHIELMSAHELATAARPHLPAQLPFDEALLPEAIAAVRTHVEILSDAAARIEPLLPAAAPAELSADAAAVLRVARDVLREADWNPEALATALKDVATQAGVKGRELYEPLRMALTGAPHGPPLVAVLRVQGQPQVLRALDDALAQTGRITQGGYSE